MNKRLLLFALFSFINSCCLVAQQQELTKYLIRGACINSNDISEYYRRDGAYLVFYEENNTEYLALVKSKDNTQTYGEVTEKRGRRDNDESSSLEHSISDFFWYIHEDKDNRRVANCRLEIERSEDFISFLFTYHCSEGDSAFFSGIVIEPVIYRDSNYVYRYDDYNRIPTPNNKTVKALYSTNRGIKECDAQISFELDYPHGNSKFDRLFRDNISKKIFHYLGTYDESGDIQFYMPSENAYPMLDYYGVSYLDGLNNTIPLYVTDTLGFRTKISITRLAESNDFVTYKEYHYFEDPYYAMTHPSISEFYYTCSKTTGEPLSIDSVFNESGIVRVKSLLLSKLSIDFSERSNDYYDVEDILLSVSEKLNNGLVLDSVLNGAEYTIAPLKIENFPISSIALLPQGVLFYYPVYELAPWAWGAFAIILDYLDVYEYLNPTIKDQLSSIGRSFSDNTETNDKKCQEAIDYLAKGDYDSAELLLYNNSFENSIDDIDRQQRLLALIQMKRGEDKLAISTYDSLFSSVDETKRLTSYWTESLNYAILKCTSGDLEYGRKLLSNIRKNTPPRPVVLEDYFGLALTNSIDFAAETEEMIHYSDLLYQIDTLINGPNVLDRFNYLSRNLRFYSTDSTVRQALTISEELLDIIENNLLVLYSPELFGTSVLRKSSQDIWKIQRIRSFLFSRINDYESSINCLETGFRQLEGKDEIEDLYYYDNLSLLYLKAGLVDKAANIVDTCYSRLLDYTRRAVGSLSLDKRNSLYEFASNWLLEDLPNVLTKADVKDKAKTLFSAALIGKNLKIATERTLSDIVDSSNNPVVLAEYGTIQDLLLKIDYAVSNNESSVIVDSLKRIYYLREKELSKRSLAYGNYLALFDLSYEDIIPKLNNKDAAIEFINYKNNDVVSYYALILTLKTGHPVLLHLFDLPVFAANKPISIYDAYDKIWYPIINLCKGVDRFYFSPSGILSISPIENCLELPTKKKFIRLSTCRELLKKDTPDSNLNNNAVLFGGLSFDADINTVDGFPSEVVTFSDNNKSFIGRGTKNPLPNTLEEVNIISRLLSKHNYHVDLYTGVKGTETMFKSLNGKPIKFLHIATHGFYISDSELHRGDNIRYISNVDNTINTEDNELTRSGLLLTGANKVLGGHASNNPLDNGILSAVEVSRMDLSGLDLVALSACQSGLGDVTKEGVMGLQRGFKKAGARSMLLTLWEVDDEATSILMQHFYKKAMAGIPYREALRSAQRYLRENGFSNYIYWAAFVLID